MLINTLKKNSYSITMLNKLPKLYSYNTLAFYKQNRFPSRHYPPANKEWKHSVYVYNKDYLKSLAIKNEIVNHVIESFFSMNRKKVKGTSKSKRVRDLTRMSKTKQFYVSNAEIKQNSDKAIVTVYLFDRESQVLIRKLFFFNRFLEKNEILTLRKMLINTPLNNYKKFLSLKVKLFNRKKVPFRITSKKIELINRRKKEEIFKHRKFKSISNKKRYFLHYKLRYNNYKILLLNSLLKKKEKIKYFFIFKFTNWVLSLFNLRVYLLKYKNNEKFTKLKKGKLVITLGEKRTVKKKQAITFFFEDQKKMCIKLLNFVFFLLKHNRKTSLKQRCDISYLFNQFKQKHYRTFMKKQLKKEITAINCFSRFSLKGFKLGKATVMLKQCLHNIYNKKIELNLVNLKYLHMNSDILIKAIIIKFKKRRSDISKLLNKSIKLVQIPNEKYLVLKNKPTKFNLDVYKGMSTNNVISDNENNKRLFEKLSKQIYSYKGKIRHIYGGLSEIEIKNALNSVKYKLVTGVTLQAKGKLSKAFSATRAVFKFKYKGSLKNLDYLSNRDLKENYPTSYMLRSQYKPNLQYTLSSSTKRSGTFGVKGWVSSN